MDKKRKKGTFRALAISLLSVAMLLPGGCGKPKDDKVKVYVITKNDQVSFWDDVKRGAEDACNEFDIDLTYKAATGDNDYATQIEAINKAIDEKADYIIIAPNGNEEFDDAFKRAEAAGIQILNINSRTSYKGVVSCISSSDTDGGAVAARYAAEALLNNSNTTEELELFKNDPKAAMKEAEGSIAIIGHTAATAENRIAGFKKESMSRIVSVLTERGMTFEQMGNGLETNDETNEKFFVQGAPCATVDAAKEEAKKILGKDGNNVKVFFTTNTNTTLGVADAINEAGLTNIYVVGFNSDADEVKYLRTGVIDGLVVQNPYNMGYVSVNYARKIEDGERVASKLDTGVTFVTADNMNDDYVKTLLPKTEE
ncbi:MAG: substrate-binding domain-containing protein [Ruminococcus sp.]|nr:substrate-binding domain-containing protein [Ruminococcus sp.]